MHKILTQCHQCYSKEWYQM